MEYTDNKKGLVGAKVFTGRTHLLCYSLNIQGARTCLPNHSHKACGGGEAYTIIFFMWGKASSDRLTS